ncbi:MAG: LysM peptidoglycan-binding domain-containing protein, partial [Solirubrobacteraceae bacterium]
MRPLRFIVLAAFATLVLAPSASAHVARVVGPGETLWSIAAQNNLTTRTVAAYNGLAEDAHVVLGSTILVPTVTEGAAALARSGITPAATAGTGAPPPQGAYIVRSGDTLTGLAAQTGVPVAQMAYMNGLSATAQLLTGTVMKLPSGAPAPARASAPLPAQRVVPD